MPGFLEIVFLVLISGSSLVLCLGDRSPPPLYFGLLLFLAVTFAWLFRLENPGELLKRLPDGGLVVRVEAPG
eukprot:m.60660 g.60660  ORF g.60660 m.60660 type:complete len:72 (+) comp11341_c0_seq4:77-292(+)